jgi:hypothetical protein
MQKLLHYKSKLAELAANYYLCNPYNSLGKNKGKPRKYPSLYFGPNNQETAALIKAIGSPRKKSILQQIIDAAEREQTKEMAPILLYRIEPPKDGEYIDNNPLTMQEFNAMIQP